MATFSYNYCDGTNDQVDFIRRLVGDTVAENHVLEDEEILGLYRIQASVWQSAQKYSWSTGSYLSNSPVSYMRVAALAADSMSAKLASLAVIEQVLDVKISFQTASKALADKATLYRQIDDESGAFAIIEQTPTVWSFYDRYFKQVQRQSAG